MICAPTASHKLYRSNPPSGHFHSYKAYSVRQQTYVPPAGRAAPAKNKAAPEKENAVPPAQEREQKIQQTGFKIFQEKDEDKVMNFNVENPEFDKLSDYKKQDLMKRISFKKNTD